MGVSDLQIRSGIYINERILLYIIFLLLPYYAAQSGGIQPVDVPIIMAVILGASTGYLFLFFQKENLSKASAVILLLLVFYQTINLLFHLVFSLNVVIWLQYFYPIYGLVIMFVVYGICKKIHIEKGVVVLCEILTNAMFISSMLPLAMLFFTSEYHRSNLSFNNPNQIVFFVIMQLAAIFYVIFSLREAQLPVKKIRNLVLILLNMSMLLLSTSRAALFLLPLCGLLLFLLFTKDPNIILYSVVVSIISVLFIAYIYAYRGYEMQVDLIHADIVSRELGNDLLHSNFTNNFMRIFFGVGIELDSLGLEYHNNLVEIYHQSGVIALLLYVSLCVSILYDLVKQRPIYAVPFLSFIAVSMFHFILRSRFFWVLLAFIFLLLSIHQKNGIVQYQRKRKLIVD